MDAEKRLQKLEEYVPEICIRHDEQMKTMFSYTQEIKDAVKWGVRMVIGAVFVAVTTTVIGILVSRALAQR